MNTAPIVSKVWSFCTTLRDDGVSYGDYLEQLTYLIFLKMADEYARPPYNRDVGIPPEYNWQSLKSKRGAELEVHYVTLLRELATKEVVREVMLEGAFGYELAFSLDGNLIGVSQSELKWTPSARKWVDVWDVETLQRVARVSDYAQATNAISFSHTGAHLATSHADSTVMVWDLKQFRTDETVTP